MPSTLTPTNVYRQRQGEFLNQYRAGAELASVRFTCVVNGAEQTCRSIGDRLYLGRSPWREANVQDHWLLGDRSQNVNCKVESSNSFRTTIIYRFLCGYIHAFPSASASKLTPSNEYVDDCVQRCICKCVYTRYAYMFYIHVYQPHGFKRHFLYLYIISLQKCMYLVIQVLCFMYCYVI